MSQSIRRLTQAISASLLGLLSLLLFCPTVIAQSSVVQLPNPSQNSANNSRTTRMVSSQLPTDLPGALLQTERALNRPMPSSWGNKMKFGQLVEQIRRSGLRIRLDESANDNQLDGESVVLMRLPGRTITENLSWLLHEYDCAYRITEEGTLDILSNDALFDNQDVVTYSIGNLVQSYDQGEEVVDYIQETIDPDSWESNGGNGRMRIIRSGRGFMMTIAQTYNNQVRVRKQLISMNRMGGGVASPSYLAGTTTRSVKLPESEGSYGRGWSNGSSFGGGNRGGLGGGLGGGVF